MSKPYLIIQPGQKLSTMEAIEGDFDHWMLSAMGKSAKNTQVIYPHRGDCLPGVSDIEAVIVTGSGAMVTDGEAWIEPLCTWIRDFVVTGKPLMGICFGHQILAHALGGEVRDNPRGIEVGTVKTCLTEAAKSDVLFAGMPAIAEVQASHLQSVVRLPQEAQLLSHSTLDPHHAFRLGEQVWGIQFHPEFNCTITRAYIARWAEKLAERGGSPEQAVENCKETPFGARILARFGQYWG